MSRSSTRTSATDRTTPQQVGDSRIAAARSAADIAACRELFLEYQRALGVSLCFQGFDEELRTLPGAYAPPRGGLWIARMDGGGEAAGCVALRPLKDGDAELKRLYVRPACRGRFLGRALTIHALDFARASGYLNVRLDTLPSMREAQKLYGELGFVDVPAYYANPIEGVRYLALALATPRK
jgi:putative acetyltransferase